MPTPIRTKRKVRPPHAMGLDFMKGSKINSRINTMVKFTNVFRRFGGIMEETFTKFDVGTIKKWGSFAFDAYKKVSEKVFGGIGSKMANTGMKVVAPFGRFFEKIGSIKKKKVKKFTEGMGAMASIPMGIFSGLLQVLMKLGVLDPILNVINAIFSIIGGNVLQQLMPLMQELFDILLGPEAMALYEEVATLLAVMMKPFLNLAINLLPMIIPVLTMIVQALQAVMPFMNWFIYGLGFITEGFAFMKPILDGITTIWENGVMPVIRGIKGFFDWLSSLNPMNWFDSGGSSGGGGKSEKKDQWWDPLNWFGPDIYKFSSPQVIGVGDEPRDEILMREDRLQGLLGAARSSGGGNEMMSLQLDQLIEVNKATYNKISTNERVRKKYR